MHRQRWLGEVIGKGSEGTEVIKRMFVTENKDVEVDGLCEQDTVRYFELDQNGQVKKEPEELKKPQILKRKAKESEISAVDIECSKDVTDKDLIGTPKIQ